jgi:uncharacterized protein YndB with AHSA1/START domain
MSEHTVVVIKTINASREELFEAFTNPEIMSKWFFPEDDMSVDVTNEFNVGGSYMLKMHAGNGDIYTHVGEYREIVPNEKLVFTWNSDFVQNTLVTVTFSETDAGTEITISHDLLPEGEMADNHRKGWGGCLKRLESTMVG